MEAVKNFFQPITRDRSQQESLGWWFSCLDNLESFTSLGVSSKEIHIHTRHDEERSYKIYIDGEESFGYPFFSFLVLKLVASWFSPELLVTSFFAKLYIRKIESIELAKDNPENNQEILTCGRVLQAAKEFFTPHAERQVFKLHERALDWFFSSDFLAAHTSSRSVLYQGSCLCLDTLKLGTLGFLVKRYTLLSTLGLGLCLDAKRWVRYTREDELEAERLQREQEQEAQRRQQAALLLRYQEECPRPPRISGTPQANLERWFKQWQCQAFFPLYAMGYDFQSVSQGVSFCGSEKQKEKEDRDIKLSIGKQEFTLKESFVKKVPFLMGFLAFHQEEAIQLSESFSVSMQVFETIQEHIDDINHEWVTEEIKSALDFLCIDLTFPHCEAVLNFQEIAAHRLEDLAENDKFARHIASPPAVKVGSPSYFHFDLKLPPEESPIKIHETDRILSKAEEILSRAHEYSRTYLINALLSEVITNSLQSSNKIIPSLISLFGRKPTLKDHVSILELPKIRDMRELGNLLQQAPRLIWLSIANQESIDIASLPVMENLRVFKVDALFYTRNIEGLLQEKMPNVEVTEIEWTSKTFDQWLEEQRGVS